MGSAVSDAIRLNDLTLGYDGHPAVHHLDGAFAQGSLTAIVGPNGSGKSTLLKGIMGTLSPIGGAGIRDVSAALQLANMQVQTLGEDIYLHGYLQSPPPE